MQHLIKMKDSYFQQEFSDSTKERISIFFNFSSDENLLCGLWTAPFFRYGFTVTNKALYWYLKTEAGIKSGGILKTLNQNIEFHISPYISSENSTASLAGSVAEECSKLEIRTSEKTEEFFITGLTEEKGKTLCDILKFAFTQGELPKTDLGNLVKIPRLLPLRSFFDEVMNIAGGTIQKFDDFKDSLAKGFHEVTHIKFKIKRMNEPENNSSKEKKQKSEKTTEAEPKQEFEFEEDSRKTESSSKTKDEEKSPKNQNPPVQHNHVFAFFLNFLDVFASLIFIASIVVISRSELITKLSIPSEQLPKIALAVFTVLKCIVAFYSKNTARKIIAILLVVISILANILLSYSLIMNQEGTKFFIIVSIVLCLLSYFAFEFSCGFKTESILNKVLYIIILGFVAYIMAYYAIYEQKAELKEAAKYFWNQISEFCKTL